MLHYGDLDEPLLVVQLPMMVLILWEAARHVASSTDTQYRISHKSESCRVKIKDSTYKWSDASSPSHTLG